MNLLLLILCALLVAAIQARLPTFWWLGGIRLELVPSVAAHAALFLPLPRAVAMVAVAGLAQDALSAAPFGMSVLAYGVMALVLHAVRESLDRDFVLVHMGTAALMAVAGSVAAFCVVGFGWGYFAKMVLVAMLAGLVAPPVFMALDGLRCCRTEGRA